MPSPPIAHLAHTVSPPPPAARSDEGNEYFLFGYAVLATPFTAGRLPSRWRPYPIAGTRQRSYKFVFQEKHRARICGEQFYYAL